MKISLNIESNNIIKQNSYKGEGRFICNMPILSSYDRTDSGYANCLLKAFWKDNLINVFASWLGMISTNQFEGDYWIFFFSLVILFYVILNLCLQYFFPNWSLVFLDVRKPWNLIHKTQMIILHYFLPIWSFIKLKSWVLVTSLYPSLLSPSSSYQP